MPTYIMEQQLDASILDQLLREPLGHNELMRKSGIADRPLRRRLKCLMSHRYVSRHGRGWKRGKRIRYSLTKQGYAYYEKIRDIAALQRVATALADWRIANDDEHATATFLELFVSLYRLTRNRFHEKRNIKIYDDFITRAEMAIQNYLNEDLASQDSGKVHGPLRSPYHEFYMMDIRRYSEALREDGKLAYQSGHGLTQCHVDLLCNLLKLYDKESLLSHNEEWLEQRKGLVIQQELQKEFDQRRMQLEQKYPAAFVTEFGLGHPSKRGMELALPSEATSRVPDSHISRKAS